MPNLDKFDLAILECLQEDARATNVEIAEKVNLSPSPCLRRIRNLEKTGVIRGYRADIDRKEVGLGLTVFVELKVAHHSRENAQAQEAALLAIPEVVSCFLISGTADFLAEVVVEDLQSTCGTYVNGEATGYGGRRALRAGDRVSMGDLVVTVWVEG